MELKNNQLITTARYIFKVLIWVPPIFIAFFIFGFSSQGGSESSGLSRKAAVAVITVADDSHILHVTDQNRETYIENLQYPIRKGAHMTEYMIFTLSVMVALYVWRVRCRIVYLESFMIAFIFACTDELHQLYVPGRSGRFTDVLIDGTGALTGLLFVWLIIRVTKKHKLKKSNSGGSKI